MAAKVALTAEEFRENSQRSIALFNTEKLSTNSTHVLKSAYCNSVHFCRCNLHGACGGKDQIPERPRRVVALQSARGVWRQREIKPRKYSLSYPALQSARGVWRQRISESIELASDLLQSARGVWRQRVIHHRSSSVVPLQSARGVWRQRPVMSRQYIEILVAICTGRVEAKFCCVNGAFDGGGCNLHGACGGKVDATCEAIIAKRCNLHGACGGKDLTSTWGTMAQSVAICTGRVEAKLSSHCVTSVSFELQSARGVWRQSPFQRATQKPSASLQSARGVWRQRCTSISSVLLINRCNLHGACGGKDNDEIVALVSPGCNLHGACGGKVSGEDIHFVNLLVAICTGRVENLASSPEKNEKIYADLLHFYSS